MRFLTWVVILAVAAWSGYWFLGSTGIERGLTGWFEERRSEGWAADASDISTNGFPNRFDTTITDVRLADPATGAAWSMPFFQILTLSYKPNHIIAVFPDSQTLASPTEKITIRNDLLRGSVLLVPDTALELDRSTFELEKMNVGSSSGWRVDIASGQLSTRRTGLENSYDIFFDAKGLNPNRGLMKLLDPKAMLSDTFDQFKLDARATFDAPWDRFAIEQRRPQPTQINIKSLSAEWGKLLLQAAGTLDVDANGRATGTLDVRAKNWREMLRVIASTGALPRQFLPIIEGALEALAKASGHPNTLDAPLIFRRGNMFLAGIPIGPAPSLQLQ